MSVKQTIAESGVLRACLDLLICERIWHERRNTLPVWVGEGKKRRPVTVAKPGTADIFSTPQAHNPPFRSGMRRIHSRWDAVICKDECCPSPMVLWIETKSSNGEQRQKQKEFQAEVEAAGHYYLLVRDVDELKQWLRAHGVIR